MFYSQKHLGGGMFSLIINKITHHYFGTTKKNHAMEIHTVDLHIHISKSWELAKSLVLIFIHGS